VKIHPWESRFLLAPIFLVASLMLAQSMPAQRGPGAPAAAGQAPPAPQAPANTPPSSTASVAPDAVVLILNGVCKDKPANDAECKTVVTRAQFETILNTVTASQPNPQPVTPEVKRQLAIQYLRLLLFSNEAEKQGLENQPEARELLRLARMQALAQVLTHTMQQKAKPTPEEMQKYYNDNRLRFRELTLERIMIPVKAGADAQGNMKKFAAELRQRAASGADFKTLQAEASKKAGLPNPPDTRVVLQAETIPADHVAVLQLKEGEVSQPIQDHAGFYIYKLVGQQQVPLDRVRAQLEATLTQQRMQQEIESLLRTASPNLNDAYFGLAERAPGGVGAPLVPGSPGNTAPPGAPPKP